MKNTRIIYLSGPMKGHPQNNKKLFKKGEILLKEKGWEVINPHTTIELCFGGDTTLPREVYMRKDIELLVSANAIALLPLWRFSRKSVVEKALATELGLDVLFLASMELEN